MVPKQRKRKIKKPVRPSEPDKANVSIKYNIDAPIEDIAKEEPITPEKFSIKELREEKLKDVSFGTKSEKRTKDRIEPLREEKLTEPLLDEKKTSRIFLWVSILIIIGLIVLIINLDKIVPRNESVSDVLATVNGQPITQDYLDRLYTASVPQQFRETIGKDVFLEKSVIPQAVLLQEAKNHDFVVSDKEIEDIVDNLIEQSGLGKDEFYQKLKEDNLDIEDIRSIYRNNMIINLLLNKTILANVEVGLSEQVKASHILVETEEEAVSILAELREGADFSELAKEKSKDPSAKINSGDLGYFEKGAMVPEFEEAAFSLSVGDLSEPVKTSFGYHIIKVDDKKPARTIKYSEITDTNERQLAYEKNKAVIQTYIDALVARADIKISENVTSAEITEPVEPEEKEETEEVEELEPEGKEEPEEVETKEIDLDAFTSCLAEKDATIYASTVCDYCKEQEELLGDGFSKIKTVVCYDGTTEQQTDECENLGIEGYPTWIIDGKQLKGLQSLESLSEESGCSLY